MTTGSHRHWSLLLVFATACLSSVTVVTTSTSASSSSSSSSLHGVASSPSSTSSKLSGILRARPRKLSSSVACTRRTLMTTVSFPRPFYGSIFAKGFGPDQCNVIGNGSRVINFKTNANKCGIATVENGGQDTEYQMYLYIQYEQRLHESTFDERIFVRCSPQAIQLSGAMGREGDEVGREGAHGPVAPAVPSSSVSLTPVAELHPPGEMLYMSLNPNLKSLTSSQDGGHLEDSTRLVMKTMASHHFAQGFSEKDVDSKMDIKKGRMGNLRPIDGFVDIGQDVTVLVRTKNIDGIDTKLGRCYAHDGTHATQHGLTDDDGCTLDSVIMPNFKEAPTNGHSKLLYTSFPAFKFPDKSNLHIQCTLVICNATCPKYDCQDTFYGNGNGRVVPVTLDGDDEEEPVAVLKSSHRSQRSLTFFAPVGRVKKLVKFDPNKKHHGLGAEGGHDRDGGEPRSHHKLRTGGNGPQEPFNLSPSIFSQLELGSPSLAFREQPAPSSRPPSSPPTRPPPSVRRNPSSQVTSLPTKAQTMHSHHQSSNQGPKNDKSAGDVIESQAKNRPNKGPGKEYVSLEDDSLLLFSSPLSCFGTPSVVVVLAVLFSSLLAALTFAICMTVKVKALRQRLSLYEGHVTSNKRAFYPYHSAARSYARAPYGRMMDIGFH